MHQRIGQHGLVQEPVHRCACKGGRGIGSHGHSDEVTRRVEWDGVSIRKRIQIDDQHGSRCAIRLRLHPGVRTSKIVEADRKSTLSHDLAIEQRVEMLIDREDGDGHPRQPVEVWLRLRFGDMHRQAHLEARSHARFAFDGDRATHAIDELAADGQAEAGTAIATRNRTVDLREITEQGRKLVGCDADAGVLDDDLKFSLVFGSVDHVNVHMDMALRRELDTIADEVDQNLANAARIADQLARNARRHEGTDIERLFMGLRRGDFERIRDHGLDVERNRLELDLVGFELGHIENVVDELKQMLGR